MLQSTDHGNLNLGVQMRQILDFLDFDSKPVFIQLSEKLLVSFLLQSEISFGSDNLRTAWNVSYVK